MCELCAPRVSRRTALALAGGVIATAVVSARGGAAGARAVSAPTGLEIEFRSVWADDSRPPTGPLESEDVRFLVVHHSASAIGAEPIGVMRSVYDFHTGPEKGWSDVAYNFFIDQNGVVYEGRTGSLDDPVAASATGGNQGFSQLVCLLGDFTNELPTDATLDSLVRTLAWLADRYGVDTATDATTTFVSRGSNLWPEGESVIADTISGHREMSRTACPGDTFFPHLKGEVWPRVDQLRSAAPPDTAPVTSDSRVPPATRVTVPPSTAPPPSSTTSTTSTSSTTAPPTLTEAPQTSGAETTLGESDDLNVAASSSTAESSINVPLAVAGAASLAVGGAAVVVGLRGRAAGPTEPAVPQGPDETPDE